MAMASTTTTGDIVESTATSETRRNIFHEYDKPIVLIGCSSTNDGLEMNRLAEYWVRRNHQEQQDTTSTDKDSCSSAIIRPSSFDPSEILSLVSGGSLTWSNVILIDFATLSFDDDVADEGRYIELVEQLYSHQELLSIYVNVDPTSSSMNLPLADVKSRLEDGVFVKYSDYELCIKDEGRTAFASSIADSDDGSNWEHIQWEFTRIIARARLAPAIPGSQSPSSNTAHLTMGDHTFFLSLSFPNIKEVEPYVQDMCIDVDAMEYRTDLLDCRDSRFDLLYGMQLLRRFSRPHVVRVPALPLPGAMPVLEDVMPIVYTVRTQNQAGTYPDDEAGISKMFDLLYWGLRGGVEVLDVESAWDAVRTNDLLTTAEQRYASQILGSHHVVGTEISTEEAVHLFQQCSLDGRAHGAKVVLSIESSNKDKMAHEAALLAASLAARDGKPVIPNISLILGDVGRYSRVINLPFTPVTHESLPFKAAPGQMSASEIMAARVLTKIITTKRYVILGHNIAYSVSPQMQGSAFAATRLPHNYGRADVETVEEFVESDFFKDPSFGGCSVTIPHKQAIIPYVDVMSDAASTIGSVNTLIVKQEIIGDEFKRVIYGDNTDWKGIYNPLERKLGKRNEDEDVVLILGGGGTARAAAYAASMLGLKRLYYNRTPSKAQDLVDSFGGTVISSIDELKGDHNNIKVVISTLPAGAEFVLPDWLLEVHNKPVVFDVNYKPYYTKLLEQAEKAGCQVVRGSEMLWEQGKDLIYSLKLLSAASILGAREQMLYQIAVMCYKYTTHIVRSFFLLIATTILTMGTGVGQFEAWTGRTAPYAVMKAVVLENCIPKEAEPS
jgi:pentafunctional AROM polypeptide